MLFTGADPHTHKALRICLMSAYSSHVRDACGSVLGGAYGSAASHLPCLVCFTLMIGLDT